MTKVPLLDLQAQYAPIREDVLAAIARVCDSQIFINGPEVDALEREIAAQLGVAHAVGVSSGTDALIVALMALGVGAGDEVVTSAYSFFATAGAIARLGARPVFVDIDPATFNIEPARVAAAITPKTKALIPVHLFGLVADMAPIAAIAEERGIPIIEDAAQAIGAKRYGRLAGQFGAISCFSFFPTKNLGAFGDAGLVTTDDAAYAAHVRILRNHGMEPKYVHKEVGGNFRLDALQAAVIRVKAPHLTAWTMARQRNAEKYNVLIEAAGLRNDVQIPVAPADSFHIYNQFVVRVPRRDELRAFLKARGIETEVYYPVPLHLQECFGGLGYRAGAFPHAEAAAAQSLALPIYGELTGEQLASVVDAMAAFFVK